jgi:drug/metabolite transporter (DMT)-like permease
MPKLTKERKGMCFITGVMIYWGLTTVLMKHALLYMNSSTYIMLRFVCAAFIVGIIYRKRLYREFSKSLLIKGCILGTLLIIPMECTVLGLSFTTVSNSVFISQLSFILVPLMLCIRNRKLPHRYLWLGMAGLFSGLFVFSDVYHVGLNKGDFITMISAVFNSLSVIAMSRYTKTEDPQLLGVLQILFATVFSIVIGITNLQPVIINIHSVTILFLTGIIGTGIAFIASAVGQSMTNPITTSFLQIINPVFGMIGAAVIADQAGRHEQITINKLAGSFIIVLSLIFYIYMENRNYFSKRIKNSQMNNR